MYRIFDQPLIRYRKTRRVRYPYRDFTIAIKDLTDILSGTLNGELKVSKAYKERTETNITVSPSVEYGNHTSWSAYIK